MKIYLQIKRLNEMTGTGEARRSSTFCNIVAIRILNLYRRVSVTFEVPIQIPSLLQATMAGLLKNKLKVALIQLAAGKW